MADETNSNNNRGRGRDRGGKGRGGGRRGRGGKKTESRDVNDNDRGNGQWLESALVSLGHFDPTSCSSAMERSAVDEETSSSSDEHLTSLTLWLEDRIIRSW
jgi:hypothetical protein